MKKLDIHVNQEYRSFNSGFEVNLNGDLIILSGVNGSGKSQLMDIIRQQFPNDQSKAIVADIILDGTKLKNRDVIFRSFKDNFGIADMYTQGISGPINTKNQVWENYRQCQLDSNQKNLEQFQGACERSRYILIEKFGEVKFSNGQILQEDVNNTDFGDFIWQPDDIFSNFIGDEFFKYAKNVHNSIKKCGESGAKFDQNSLGLAPWIELNELFSELKLEYRFKSGINDYFLKDDDFQLNEIPKLYQLKENGDIDLDDSRSLLDLSDGEKAIITLIFASFHGTDFEFKKILLLDEFDATFNPSLTEAFFKLIEKYFVSKGILVVIATHSPVTISLAPECARFYEVFSKIKSDSRILSVGKENYAELRIANKEFYEKIAKQSERIKDLILKIDEFEKFKQKLSESTKPFIITEGFTDIKHLKKAKEKLNIIGCDIDFSFKFPTSGWGSSELKDLLKKIATFPQSRKIVGIFDRDEVKIVEDIEKGGQQFKDYGNNVYAFCIPKPSSRENYKNISIEFYYSDINLKNICDSKCMYFDNEINFDSRRKPTSRIENPEDNFEKKIWDENIGDLSWIHSKAKFAELVELNDEFAGNFDFNNFKLIFDKIKLIMN